MCVRRPLIATCSSDRSVRLWNYLERGCELAKTFQEEAHSIAIHPMGLMILVGFADKLRLMSVLMDDFKVLKELPIKSCRDVAFSNGGHLFAAVNGLTVSLYNTYTCENLGNLRGHNGKVRARTQQGVCVCVYGALMFILFHAGWIEPVHCSSPTATQPDSLPPPPPHPHPKPQPSAPSHAHTHPTQVRSIGWSADDTRLVSAGMDGAVYEWKLSDLKRDKESVLKGCQYNAGGCAACINASGCIPHVCTYFVQAHA
jgi:WD40 repeat protein